MANLFIYMRSIFYNRGTANFGRVRIYREDSAGHWPAVKEAEVISGDVQLSYSDELIVDGLNSGII